MNIIYKLNTEIKDCDSILYLPEPKEEYSGFFENYDHYILNALILLSVGEMRRDGEIFSINSTDFKINKQYNGAKAEIFVFTFERGHFCFEIFIDNFLTYSDVIENVKTEIRKKLRERG